MYQVLCDNNLLFDHGVDDLKIINPRLTLEVNKVGRFDFTIYPTHPLYGLIQKLKSVIEVYQDGVLLFRGRPLNDTMRFDKSKDIICEGDLAFFNDTIMRPYNFTGSISAFLQSIITSHNAQVESNKQFILGNVTVTDPNNLIVRSSISHDNSWSVINDKLIGILGGYIVLRRQSNINYIDYLVDSPYQSLQTIELGKNLLDVIRETRSDDIITALIPLGAKLTDESGNETDERLTIASVNGGLDYVHDAAAVTQYGWIFGTKTWDDVTDANNLLTRANQELAININLGASIELKAIDLSMVDQLIDEIRLFEYVQVTSDHHDIDTMALITKLTIDLLQPNNNIITLGFSYDSFTEKQVLSDRVIRQIQSDYVTNQSIQEVRSSVRTVSSNIQQEADAIRLEVSDTYTSKGELDEYKNQVSTQFTQTTDAIALKASQTTVDAVSAVANSKAQTFLSTPTPPYYVGDIWIETNATTGGNRVCTTERLTGAYVAGDWTKEGVTSRMDSAELRITPTAITSTVRSSTEYTNDLGGKENTVFKQNTAPAHLNGRLWLDTSVTPNIMYRSNGSAWVKATPTQASEVGAYSSGQVDTLLTSYSTITQTTDSIDLLFKKSGMQNMFVNSDMSLGLENFLFYHQTGGSYSMAIRNDVWSGYENAFQIFQPTASVTTTAQSFLYNLVPDSVYTVGCLVAGHNSNNRIQVVNFADTQIVGTSGIVSNGLGGVNLNNWKMISVTFTATDTTMRLRYVSGSTAVNGYYWAKHFQLNPGNTLASYSKRQGEFKTTKYTFDGDSAKFYDADFELWRGGVRKLYFDTTTGNYAFDGHIIANSGTIGRFAISGQDLVYTSELFNKDYDRSDVVKLQRILAGIISATPYDVQVYDTNSSGTLTTTDLVQINNFVESGTALPTPRKRIRSVVRIGTNNGAITTQAVAENGSVGPTTTIRGEKVNTDLVNTKSLATNSLSLNGETVVGVIVDSGSNANGRYMRFSDGTQICWHLDGTGIATSNATTPIRWGARAFTFPASFIETPAISPEIFRSTNSFAWSGIQEENSTGCALYILSPYNTTGFIRYIAIGRWK